MERTSTSIKNRQSICRSCGMCCDGSLFQATEIDSSVPYGSWPTEVVQAISQGKNLPQPCPALQKNLCVVYATRPKVCKDFGCILLNEYTSGAIDLEGAVAVVTATRILGMAFREAITDATGVESSSSPDALFSEFRNSFKEEFDTTQFKRKYSKVLLIYARLKYQLKTRFHNPGETSSAIAEGIECVEIAGQR